MRIRGFAVAVLIGILAVVVLGVSVSMTGSGTIGGLRPGWSILESCTPAMPGDSRGSVGSASLSAVAMSDSRFVADNEIVMSTGNGDFRGRVTDVTIDGAAASLSVAGPLQFLNVDKTMPPIWFRNENSLEFLTYGSGTGQIASPYDIAVDPVDGSIFVTSSGTVDGVDRYKVIKFDSSGNYVTEFGSNGSGNGEFGGSMHVAVSPVDQAVWVSDGANYRIQKFTRTNATTYTYSTKVGAVGSGNGQFGSTVAIPIAVDASGNVYAGDRGNTRVQKFNSSAVYQAQTTLTGGGSFAPWQVQVLGSDVYASGGVTSSGVNRSPGLLFKMTTSMGALTSTLSVPNPVDSPDGSFSGMTYFAMNSDGSFWASWVWGSILSRHEADGTQVATWQSLFPTPLTANDMLAVELTSDDVGFILNRNTVGSAPAPPSVNNPYGGNYAIGFDYSPVPLSSAIETYMEACDATLNGYTLDYQAATDPDVVFPGWSGNVWAKLKELFAIYGVELVRDDDTQTLIVRDQGSATATISQRTPITTHPENLNGDTRIVDVIYQNPRAGGGVVWDAADQNELISIEAGQMITRILYTDNHPADLALPVPTDTLPIQPGQFYVVDANGDPITAEVWTSSGATITLAVGETPGTIRATIVGPSSVLGGFTEPYYFATGRDPEDVPALQIVGNGTFCTPTVLKRTESQGSPFASPFMDTLDRALSRGHYASQTDPNVTISFTCPVSELPPVGQAVGSIITFEQSKYRILEVKRGALAADVTAERFVTAADWTTTWSGEAASVYEAYWSGYSAGDEQVQPLRHA